MKVNEWKNNQVKNEKRYSNYTHFDRRVSLNSCFGYINNPNSVSRHGFYPFIHYIAKSRKIKKGISSKPKERNIYYAAHIDSWIFRYYAFKLNEIYNSRLYDANIKSVPIAYRTDLKKNNINFAKEVFDFIRNNSPCYVMVGDFTDFFDNLDHQYLKQCLIEILGTPGELPADWYAVFKNTTKFSFVELDELIAINKLLDATIDRKKINSLERVLPISEFKKHKNIIFRNEKNVGIPQGSPISSVFANLYMLKTDIAVNEYVVKEFKGIYRRYSDDYIIVLPGLKSIEDFLKHRDNLRSLILSTPKLTLHPDKEKYYLFSENQFINISKINIDRIQFLGFAFDGKKVSLRDKTISRFYNKLYRKVRTIIKNNGVTKFGNRISNRNLYNKYSHKGSKFYIKSQAKKCSKSVNKREVKGNFLDYVKNAQDIFGNEPINGPTKNLMQKIRRELKKVQ